MTGIFELPLPDLVAMARGHLSRGFTPDECARFAIDPCPLTSSGSPHPPSPSGPSPHAFDAAESACPIARRDDHHRPGPALGRDGFLAELKDFEDQTGIHVAIVDPVSGSIDRLPDGTRPDIALVGITRGACRLARDGRLVNLSTYLDQTSLRKQLGDRTVEAATVDGGVHWLPLTAQPSGLVWYRKSVFTSGGSRCRRPGTSYRAHPADDRRRSGAVVHSDPLGPP